MKRFLKLIVIAGFFLISCRKEPLSDPRIAILNVSALSSSKCSATAFLIDHGDYPIREYGFIVSPYKSNFNLGSENSGIVIGTVPPDTFTAVLPYPKSAYENSMYVRAYVTNEIGTVYSQEQEFKVLDLYISSVSPEAAERGDTIRVYGSGFNPTAEENSIKILNTPAKILKVTPTYIEAEMPSGINQAEGIINLPVTVNTGEQEAVYYGIMAIPTILNIEPLNGTFRSVLGITVDNLTGSNDNYSVWFGETRGGINFHSGNFITSSVPYMVDRKNFKISIGLGNYRSRYSGMFHMDDMIIDSIAPRKVNLGGEFLVYGRNFNSAYSFNWAILGNTYLTVYGFGDNVLSFRVPDNIIPGNYTLSIVNQIDTAIIDGGIEVIPW